MRRLIVILAILLLAAAARIINVHNWPVWTDEGWSTWAASDHRLDVILSRVAQDRHPPLYFVSLSAWWTVAGDSRLALRFLAVAGGLLAVAVTYRIGADWFGHRAGAYAALLLSVLDIAVYYSQEIRHYSLLMLSVCLMTLFFLRFLRKPRRVMLLAYMVSIAFMLYTQYFGALFLVAHVIIGLLAWRGTLRQKVELAGAWVGATILYLPWLIAASGQFASLTDGIVGYPTSPEGLLTAANLIFGGTVAVVTGGLYVLGVWRVLRRLNYSVTLLARITIVLCGIGLFGVMFLANLRIGILSARTLVYLVPMLMLVCGYGLDSVRGRAGSVIALGLVVVILLTRSIIQPRLDSDKVAQAVAAAYRPGDLIVIESGWDDNAVRYELVLALGESAWQDIIPALPWYDYLYRMGPVVPQVEGALKTHQRVWSINWLIPSQLMPFLDSGGDGFRRVSTREISVGAQYEGRYPVPSVQIALYQR
jgi:uncharacterized membrane protein